MAKGWIRLHRQIQDCSIWVDKEPFDRRSAWVDLLLSCNHNDKDIIFDGHKITISRGQMVTSVRGLSERWSWSKDRTLRYLRLLEELEMIERESNARRTLITIVNYEIYQSVQDSNEDTHKDTHEDSNKDTRKDTHEPQTIMIKNDKNEKNEKKNIYGEYRHVRLTDSERDKLMNDFGEKETTEAIKFLDEYIEMKGYKARSHYLAIRKWVFDAVKREKAQKGGINEQSEKRTTSNGKSDIERESEYREIIRRIESGEADHDDDGLWD